MNFLDNETVELAKSVGFDGIPIRSNFVGSKEEKHFFTLQQVEEWLWEKHQDYFFNVHSKYEVDFGWTWCYFNSQSDKHEGRFYSPFTARLEGVKQALNYLKQKGESK